MILILVFDFCGFCFFFFFFHVVHHLLLWLQMMPAEFYVGRSWMVRCVTNNYYVCLKLLEICFEYNYADKLCSAIYLDDIFRCFSHICIHHFSFSCRIFLFVSAFYVWCLLACLVVGLLCEKYKLKCYFHLN